jgi:hypothetical protein
MGSGVLEVLSSHRFAGVYGLISEPATRAARVPEEV